jgi:uncharacterized protein (DUF2249 family)
VQIVKTNEAEIDDTKVKFDVRQIPPSDRHHTIFHRLALLDEGESMELVNDHEPQPLYHQIRQKYGDRFEWKYLEQGPERWRIAITKQGKTGLDINSDWKELDVREYIPVERHHLIFEAYENLRPGEAFVLVNDHDPKPLYYQFEAEMTGAFRWEYLQRGPTVWQVLIGKQAWAETSDSRQGKRKRPLPFYNIIRAQRPGNQATVILHRRFQRHNPVSLMHHFCMAIQGTGPYRSEIIDLDFNRGAVLIGVQQGGKGCPHACVNHSVNGRSVQHPVRI